MCSRRMMDRVPHSSREPTTLVLLWLVLLRPVEEALNVTEHPAPARHAFARRINGVVGAQTGNCVPDMLLAL